LGCDAVAEHEQLWAPWRLAYVSGGGGDTRERRQRDLKLLPGADPECFVCRAVADTADRENLLVERSRQSVVILNRYPYNNGHVLIAPLTHLGRPDELNDHGLLDAQQLIVKYVGLMERLLGAEGFNVGLNLGRVAGAGLPGHLHWHIVPRWSGDTNFMPALAGVRVIPQALDALWELLHTEVATGGGPSSQSSARP
jgi:ATP adenylyltransferase